MSSVTPVLRLLPEDADGVRLWEASMLINGENYLGTGMDADEALVELCEALADEIIEIG